MIFKVILLSLLVIFTNGQIVDLGPCLPVNVVQDFNVSAYLGQWYQVQRVPNRYETGNCSTALYGPVEDGLVKVHNVEIRNGTESSIDGTAELANPNSTEAKLIVKFFNPDTASDYWVLGTDYENYSVVYACEDYAYVHLGFVWILAREKPLSQEHLDIARQILHDNKVLPGDLVSFDLPECLIQP